MKEKNIILISFLILIALIGMQSVMAEDMGEINIENDQYHDNSMVIDNANVDSQNDLTDNMETDSENQESESLDLNDDSDEKSQIEDKDSKSSKLGANNLQSTVVIDGSAYNQMSNPTIQTAIDNANPGDTIIITGTSYVHCHFIINKKLTIISNVSTAMSPCPSNTRGSGTYGIFYIGPQGSGTVIQGFTLTNTIDESDCYGILVRGASDVRISDCIINTTKYGDGIRIEQSDNVIVNDSIVKNSNIGINIVNSTNIAISNNNITNNTITGIYIGENNVNTSINTNNITYNKHTGINLTSANNVFIINNFIGFNRNGDDFNSTAGAGVYINCNLTKVEIKGNFIRQNGLYGVLNDYRTRNMDAKKYAELLEVNTNNYYMGHTERLTYHIEYKPYAGGAFNYDSENDIYVYVGDGNGNYDVDKSVVYLGYAFYLSETICGATLYSAPNNAWSQSNYKLKISEITQNKKGIYSVSIVDNDGNIIKDISSIYVTFYLNKNNNDASPQSGDIYRTVLMKNGTATVDFTGETFKESGNVILACFPGLYDNYRSNPYAIFNVSDDEIPGTYSQTKISISNVKLVPKSGEYFVATLTDENGKPIANKMLSFTICSKTYNRTTDSEGKARLQINLKNEKTYTMTVNFKGDENYNKSSAKATVTIKKQTPKIASSNLNLIPKSGEYFTVRLTDENGKAIANKKISFTVCSKTYNRTTDSDGKAKLQINLKNEKTYTIVTKSAATNQYNAVSKTNKITVKTGSKKVKINIQDSQFVPKSGEYFVATVTDENGNPLADKKVSFTVCSKAYNRTTDNDGKAKLKINLKNEKVYPITVSFDGDKVYAPASSAAKITIAKESSQITSYDRTFVGNSGQTFTVALIAKNGTGLANKDIKFILDSKSYSTTTDDEGIAKLEINLEEAKTYNITSQFAGDDQYKGVNKTNTITITSENGITYIDPGLSNEEIQRIIDESPENFISKFLGKEYEDINLVISKSQNLTSDVGTVLNGKDGKAVITVNCDSVNLSNLIVNANSTTQEGIGILVKDSSSVNVENITIKNALNGEKIDDYNNGSTILPGFGISVVNSSQVNISNVNASSFESGIYAEYSEGLGIYDSEISLSNYGIKYGFGNKNTEIKRNSIIDNIGWYTMDVPEGPRGYGIFLNNSATDILITQNNISNNYMGISIDANNSTGIVITSNLIADNSLEGIRFNAGYDLAPDVVEPIVTDNAIFRNAEGPSMMILGEMSANPEGIYGAGQWDESLRLKIGPNWYGVNHLRTWDNDSGIVGVGTMCPRIKTSEIKFETLEAMDPGSYKINFYKDGELASNLVSFDIYATLNRGTDKETEVHFYVINGTGTFSFDKENYLENGNKIEISVGSLINVVDRLYSVVYTYNVADSEIPV